MFKNFGISTGLKLNQDKMEAVQVGGMQFNKNNLAHNTKEISIKIDAFRTLGVWFTTNSTAGVGLNFDERL